MMSYALTRITKPDERLGTLLLQRHALAIGWVCGAARGSHHGPRAWKRMKPSRLLHKEDTWLIALTIGCLAAIVLIQWRLG